MKSGSIVTANLQKLSFVHVDTKYEVLPNFNNIFRGHAKFLQINLFGLNHQNVTHFIYFPHHLICILEVIKNDKWCLKRAHYNLCSMYLIYWAHFGLKILLKID